MYAYVCCVYYMYVCINKYVQLDCFFKRMLYAYFFATKTLTLSLSP